MKDVKLIDVAKAAGVSPATVSRIVRNNGYVSAEKRHLVENAMRDLGYAAHGKPQEAQPEGVPQVLLITPPGASLLFENIGMQLSCEMQKQGWQMAVHYCQDTDGGSLIPIIERARVGNLRGVVFNCCGDALDFSSLRRYLNSLPIPTVMLERTPELYGLNKVMLNAEEMLFMAVRYLAHYGHRRIIYIAHDCAYDIEKKRLAGFNSGVTAMGIAAESEFVGIDSYTSANGYRALKEYIARRGLPSAIIAADQVLMGALSYLYEQGLRVPDDVSMVGLDDTFAQYASPPLTSVAFPVAEIARSTLRILNEAQHERTLPQSVLLSTRLIERSSVAAPGK